MNKNSLNFIGQYFLRSLHYVQEIKEYGGDPVCLSVCQHDSAREPLNEMELNLIRL